MIVFFGEGDTVPLRNAKLKYLKQLFVETEEPKNYHMLKPGDLAPKPTGWSLFSSPVKETLVISGHGNQHQIGIYTAVQIVEKLKTNGFSAERFDKVYLMNCDVGLQDQMNTITDNFARQFKRALGNDNTQGIDVYAPRGTIMWNHRYVNQGHTPYEVIDGMTIVTPEKTYTMNDGGMLKVHL
jgi:hypothetical protein